MPLPLAFLANNFPISGPVWFWWFSRSHLRESHFEALKMALAGILLLRRKRSQRHYLTENIKNELISAFCDILDEKNKDKISPEERP